MLAQSEMELHCPLEEAANVEDSSSDNEYPYDSNVLPTAPLGGM